MKGRTLLNRLVKVSDLLPDQLDGYLKVKLLSARGCDIVDYSKDDRSAIIPFGDDIALGESPVGISQQQLDLEVYDAICTSSGGTGKANGKG